jgi:hypothetical protein
MRGNSLMAQNLLQPRVIAKTVVSWVNTDPDQVRVVLLASTLQIEGALLLWRMVP